MLFILLSKDSSVTIGCLPLSISLSLWGYFYQDFILVFMLHRIPSLSMSPHQLYSIHIPSHAISWEWIVQGLPMLWSYLLHSITLSLGTFPLESDLQGIGPVKIIVSLSHSLSAAAHFCSSHTLPWDRPSLCVCGNILSPSPLITSPFLLYLCVFLFHLNNKSSSLGFRSCLISWFPFPSCKVF